MNSLQQEYLRDFFKVIETQKKNVLKSCASIVIIECMRRRVDEYEGIKELEQAHNVLTRRSHANLQFLKIFFW